MHTAALCRPLHKTPTYAYLYVHQSCVSFDSSGLRCPGDPRNPVFLFWFIFSDAMVQKQGLGSSLCISALFAWAVFKRESIARGYCMCTEVDKKCVLYGLSGAQSYVCPPVDCTAWPLEKLIQSQRRRSHVMAFITRTILLNKKFYR